MNGNPQDAMLAAILAGLGHKPPSGPKIISSPREKSKAKDARRKASKTAKKARRRNRK